MSTATAAITVNDYRFTSLKTTCYERSGESSNKTTTLNHCFRGRDRWHWQRLLVYGNGCAMTFSLQRPFLLKLGLKAQEHCQNDSWLLPSPHVTCLPVESTFRLGQIYAWWLTQSIGININIGCFPHTGSGHNQPAHCPYLHFSHKKAFKIQ